MKKIIYAIIALLLIASGSWYQSYQKNHKFKMESIVIGNAQTLEADTLTYVAQDQKFFTQNGLKVTIKEYTSGMEAVNAMFKGDVDLATTAEFPLVIKALNQEKISAIASINKSQLQNIIARKDRGITNISDLKGKRIGVTLGTISQFYLGRFLAIHNISLQDVTIVNVIPSESIDALTKGDADAIITWQPYASIAENALGNNAQIWPAQNNQTTYITQVAKNTWIKQHGDILNRYIKALAQAEDYYKNHSDQTKSMMQKKLNYTNTYMSAVWDKNQLSLSLDQSLILTMEDEARWMMENKLTEAKEIPNFLDYIYTDALEKVKPEAMMIVH